MGQLSEILAIARHRAETGALPYAGALTPTEAYAVWQAAPAAALVDVRTRAEWDWVGRVPDSLPIEWVLYPGNRPNAHFLDELKKQVDPESVVLFLCRSGVRSHHAAGLATQAGYSAAYNILEGFEGDRDAEGHRGRIGGWRHAGLPWIQS